MKKTYLITHKATGEQSVAEYITSEPSPLTPFGSVDVFRDKHGLIRCFHDGTGFTDYKVELIHQHYTL